MNWLKTILDALFPLRRHLFEEVDYLRAQLAQKQRRIDELQDALLAKPGVYRAESVPRGTKTVEPKPLGWDAFRRANKESHDHTDTNRAGSATGASAQQTSSAGDAAGNAAAGA